MPERAGEAERRREFLWNSSRRVPTTQMAPMAANPEGRAHLRRIPLLRLVADSFH